MNNSKKKEKVAALSIISNSILIILKLVSGILTGSMSVISEAIHSAFDLIASIIAFISVMLSSKPPDKDHPYGHGKIENISGLAEGLLIFVAAFFIIYESIKKIINPQKIEDHFIAICVMIFSAVVNIIISKILYKVAKEEDSIALEADALHLKTDVLTSFGVAAGLILIKITNIYILDPLVAILVAFLIIKESWNLCKNAFGPLLDSKLSDDDENKIIEVMNNYSSQIIDYHRLRTRKSGCVKYIDFHMTVKDDVSVKESHDLSEKIQIDMKKAMKNTSINIHIEPENKTDLHSED